MKESRDERKRRQARERQQKRRLRLKLGVDDGPVYGVVPAVVPDAVPGPDPLPPHVQAFPALHQVALQQLQEANRLSRYVRSLSAEESLTPLRSGSSPPASEARLQRAEAVRMLSAAAATPASQAKVARDVSQVDLALQIKWAKEGRPHQLNGMRIEGDRIIPGEWSTDPWDTGDGAA